LGTLHERRFFSYHPAYVRGKNLAPNPKNYQKCYTILQYSNLGHWHLNHLNPQIARALHAVGLTDKSNWTITFNNEIEMHLETTTNERGHIATGAWWTTSFKTRAKLPLYTSEPIDIAASFRINIINADLNIGNEWLRIALACAVERVDGSVVYTEMDMWDSPTALIHPSGNVRSGGNVVYQGGDVVEYKIDQITIGQWKDFTLSLTHNINDAWQLNPGDLLESVYFVVEEAGAVNVTVKADDLLITR
jgi:hypothetical protein